MHMVAARLALSMLLLAVAAHACTTHQQLHACNGCMLPAKQQEQETQ